jgi:phospholipase C
VCSEQFDHTSVLRFLEKFTGVKEPNISDWRRKTFGDLTSAFRFNDAQAAAPALPPTREQLRRAVEEAEKLPKPKAPADQKMPGQEAGIRKRLG